MAEIKEMKPGMTEQKKQAVMEQLWLTYYNDTLFAKGMITEDQRNKMRLMIKSRTAAKTRSDRQGGNREIRLPPKLFDKFQHALEKFINKCYHILR